MTNIQSSTPTAAIEEASRGLAAVLASDPSFDDALAAAEALSILSDVIPPYPPLDHPTDPADDVNVEHAVAVVLTQLDVAVESARGVEEASRCAHAARVLRTHLAAGGTR